jgi:predicted nuclease of restriction endonuclease-like (RecB) superfamily
VKTSKALDMSSDLTKNYLEVLSSLKDKIRLAKQRASLSVNAELIAIYWEIGNAILEQQKIEGWGAKIISQLARDLKMEFPDMKGFSERNLVYMQTFAAAYPWNQFTQPLVAQIQSNVASNSIVQAELAQSNPSPFPIVQPLVAQIPWTHHTILLDKLKTLDDRLFYIQKTVENGWSKAVLQHQIASKLHTRQGKAITNFGTTLPKPLSDLAQETLKSPYSFDFLSLSEEMRERDLEKALIQHLKKFMLELGRGFAYVGNQYNLNVQGDDFFLDLLFFNIHLNCYVVFELKVGEFKPEFAGKLNFYINALDGQVKADYHSPTIGVLLCKTSNKTVINYALKTVNSPIGVADYELTNALPKELVGELPSIEELEIVIDEETEKLLKPRDKKLNKIKDLIQQLNTEPIQETQNQENTARIFYDFVIPLKRGIVEILSKDVAPMFNEMQTTIWVGNQGFFIDEEEKAIQHLKEKLNFQCGRFAVYTQFNVFKQAGLNAFNISNEIEVDLGNNSYGIKLKNRNEPPILKLYHQLPSNDEINEFVEKFTEGVLDDITREVERIKENNK